MKSDLGLIMFRRFNYLHLRHLLYLQDELSCLEKKLYYADLADPEHINLRSRQLDSNAERKSMMVAIAAKLKEYGKVMRTLRSEQVVDSSR